MLPVPNYKAYEKFRADEPINSIERNTVIEYLKSGVVVAPQDTDLILERLIDKEFDGAGLFDFFTARQAATFIVNQTFHEIQGYITERCGMFGATEPLKVRSGSTKMKNLLIENMALSLPVTVSWRDAKIITMYMQGSENRSIALFFHTDSIAIGSVIMSYGVESMFKQLRTLVNNNFEEIFGINQAYASLSLLDQVKPATVLAWKSILTSMHSSEFDMLPLDKRMKIGVELAKLQGSITGETTERVEITHSSNAVYKELLDEFGSIDVTEYKKAIGINEPKRI